MIRPAFLCLCMLLLSSCGTSGDSHSAIRVGLAQLPITVDPRFATDASSVRIQEFLHRGLVTLDTSFNIKGDLAERWENPDPLVWHFSLKQGVTFSDGSEVHASDVAATLRAVIGSDLTSPLKASFASIERIEVKSDYRLTIYLSKRDASLLSRLNIGILPEQVAAAPHHARQAIGCGPYRLTVWDESGIMLERRGGVEGVSRIHFIGVKDPVTRVLKLTRGELDFVQNDLPPHLLPYLARQQHLTMKTAPSTTFSYIGLNLQDDILDDLLVRRALALALDREKLKAALFSDLPEIAETVLSPSHWASSPLSQGVFDPIEAERLMDRAGFPRGEGGIRFSLTYRTSTDPTRLLLATAVAAMWEKVGVKVSIESLEWGGFYARIKRGDFQVFSLSWVGITDPDIYRWILHSEMWPPKGSNRGRYSSIEVDQWLDEAAAAETHESRRKLYAKVQQRMHDDMVYIPLWYEPVIAVYGSRIGDFNPMSNGSLKGLIQAR